MGNLGKVVLEKSAPSEVVLGQPYTYSIKATNRGNLTVRDVVVTDVFASGFHMISAEPAGQDADDRTQWDLG